MFVDLTVSWGSLPLSALIVQNVLPRILLLLVLEEEHL